jgi:Leucine-rich repeat (LRR) protein
MFFFLVPCAGPIHFGDKVKLINLEFLDLSYNLLTQTIPGCLFTYPALKALDLSRNQFSGVLEEIPSPSRMLTCVDLSGNHLSGPVPRSFARFMALEILNIDYNNFSGTLHLSFYFRLRNLTLLSASNNKLLSAAWNASGADISSSNNISASSSWLGYHPSNTYMATSLSLVLSSCNVTILPFTVQQIPQLDTLDLSCNHIQGENPSWIWKKVDSLNLSHNMFTEIAQPPASAILSTINLSYNMLSGAVPLPSTGTIQDYSHNKFTSIPSRAFGRQFRFAYSINLPS